MTILFLGLVGLVVVLGAGALAVLAVMPWLAARAVDRFSTEELGAGLAIPMRDSDTRRTPRESTHVTRQAGNGVEKSTTPG